MTVRCTLHHTIGGIEQAPRVFDGPSWPEIAEQVRAWCDEMSSACDFHLARVEVVRVGPISGDTE